METKTSHEKEASISQCRQEHRAELEQIEKQWRLANYLAGAQLYLKENFLLSDPLKPEHIKDRLLGHWGTVPGINLIYAHLNRMIRKYDLDMFLVTGPGHGAPGNLANLYLEGSLQEFYPDLTLDYKGLAKFIKRFSWPGGFPSHLYPGLPGTIHEGGELGYALATSFGAVLDNPNLIVTCIVGDGEAETGPTATAWHCTKFLDPKESGAVIPILHLNGYKISNPTIYGTMDDHELIHLFEGYGYQSRIVSHNDKHAEFYLAIEWAYKEILDIQHAARSGSPISKPRFPMIIFRSLKGWTGIKEIDGVKIEGTCRAHQIPAKEAKTNPQQLAHVEKWLRSYHIDELLDANGTPIQEILDNCPKGEKRMGMNPHTFGGNDFKPLDLPSINDFEVHLPKEPLRGSHTRRNVHELGHYLREVTVRNPSSFRVFSPDELESNQLGELLEVTNRDYQWPIHPYDGKISNQDGRIIEMLSEHTCQGWLQGYLMTGRHGFFPSYEAFLSIASTMMLQFAKFLKFSRETSWRKPFASLNYLETSTLWRQEHNGFSHQSPGLINILLNLKPNIARIYLPPDANTLISTFDHCLQSRGYVNLVVAGKQEMPQWLSMEEAIEHCRAGGGIWKWASTDEGVDPDVVLCGIGDNPHLEVMAAAQILRQEFPHLRVRVVNITDLLILERHTLHPHGLSPELFEALFTKDRPVIINFHGYPSVIKQLLYERNIHHRCSIHGYLEEGTTTTPFDMCVRNKTSRYHLIIEAIKQAAPFNKQVESKAVDMISHFEYVLREHRAYIDEHGTDPAEITDWRWE
ncbi:MAG: phosphoketolase family protein [Chlamydiales bacterium]|nr:phosphoketolase family protein [Chlamydiales bacterium]